LIKISAVFPPTLLFLPCGTFSFVDPGGSSKSRKFRDTICSAYNSLFFRAVGPAGESLFYILRDGPRHFAMGRGKLFLGDGPRAGRRIPIGVGKRGPWRYFPLPGNLGQTQAHRKKAAARPTQLEFLHARLRQIPAAALTTFDIANGGCTGPSHGWRCPHRGTSAGWAPSAAGSVVFALTFVDGPKAAL